MQLYLNTFGTYLHVKDALFELRVPVQGGSSKVHHFAAKKVTAILLTVAGALSTDALRLAARHQVDIIYADSSGQPIGRFWHAKLGSTTNIRKKQLAASLDERGLEWTVDWLVEKLERQATLLESLRKHRAKYQELLSEQAASIRNLGQSMTVLRQEHTTTEAAAASLRGLEGTAGRLYFQTISKLLPEKYRFAGRSFRPAQDAFNAFLNYGYGVLYSRIEKALMIAGLDPYVGFLHRDDYNHLSMVYDFIEPYRVWIDKVVFSLFARKQVHQEQYAELASGITLTKPGKEVLLAALTDYLDTKKIRYRQRNLTRSHALQLDAHRFAQQLIGKAESGYEIIEL
jgi:CRISPR-associated protein Cas1